MNNLNIIELFSGIGGFTKGFEDAGYTIGKHYFSEIDKHAIANYKYNFPNAEYIGSVVDIRPDNFRDIDIITFGSPCQDFSLAGKRKGLEGDRSSLIQYAINLISHIRPSIFIWENVKGALSSNSGADFWAILQAFANIGGYRLEWQLLNTKWFLPQNRERIYLIGHLADRSEPGVFPITENDARINERTIEARSIRTLTAGGNSGGLHSSITLVKTLQGSDTLNTIRSGGRGSLTDKHSWDIVQVKSATSKGYEIANEGDSINLSNPNSETRRGRVGKGVAQTLDCSCNQAVMVVGFERTEEAKEKRSKSIKENGIDTGNFSGRQLKLKNQDYSDTILANPNHQKEGLIAEFKIGAFRGRNPDNPSQRIAGQYQEQTLELNKNGVANTLSTVQKDNVVISQKPRGYNKGGDLSICPTITKNSFEHNNHINNIRRLTEIECERLQGFPDNWTEYGNYDGVIKKVPKTQRYKMCGNAVTVKVVEEVAKRLKLNL